MWFSVVCTLIGNDTRHPVVKMLWTYEAQPSESVGLASATDVTV